MLQKISIKLYQHKKNPVYNKNTTAFFNSFKEYNCHPAKPNDLRPSRIYVSH